MRLDMTKKKDGLDEMMGVDLEVMRKKLNKLMEIFEEKHKDSKDYVEIDLPGSIPKIPYRVVNEMDLLYSKSELIYFAVEQILRNYPFWVELYNEDVLTYQDEVEGDEGDDDDEGEDGEEG